MSGADFILDDYFSDLTTSNHPLPKDVPKELLAFHVLGLALGQVLDGGKVADRTTIPVRREFLVSLAEALSLLGGMDPNTHRLDATLEDLRREFSRFLFRLTHCGLREKCGGSYYFGNFRLGKKWGPTNPAFDALGDLEQELVETQEILECIIQFFEDRGRVGGEVQSGVRRFLQRFIHVARHTDFDRIL